MFVKNDIYIYSNYHTYSSSSHHHRLTKGVAFRGSGEKTHLFNHKAGEKDVKKDPPPCGVKRPCCSIASESTTRLEVDSHLSEKAAAVVLCYTLAHITSPGCVRSEPKTKTLSSHSRGGLNDPSQSDPSRAGSDRVQKKGPDLGPEAGSGRWVC